MHRALMTNGPEGFGPEINLRNQHASEHCHNRIVALGKLASISVDSVDEMTGASRSLPGPLAPAPYGQACIGCVRAKCKCFYQFGGTECERCHRLGKQCEPSTNTRKRKAIAQPSTQPRPIPPPPAIPQLEETVDDFASLLSMQTAEATSRLPWDQQESLQDDSPGKPASTSSLAFTPGDSTSAMTVREEDPDLLVTLNPSVVQFLRRTDHGAAAASTIFADVTVHNVSVRLADENLATFKRAFLSTFPFVHIPNTVSSTELLMQKPFLWLVIMALTVKNAAQQFAMEETIWDIISKRIVVQQHASLDLLLGVICFASWSHYFKQDKPFMTMLSGVAVALAFEIGLHKDVSMASNLKRGARNSEKLPDRRPANRSMEDRRTFLAVFHLTSATWTSYRQTEPLRWTRYLDECLSVLTEGIETDLDILLVTQIKCQIITNSLTCPHSDEAADNEHLNGPSTVLMAAMKGRLNDVKQSLLPQARSARTSQFYLCSTETAILECFLSRKPQQNDRTGASHFRRIQDLQSILDSVERWLNLFLDMPSIYWAGVSVDTFAQFTHSLVVLLRLTTLEEPGWDRDEVRRRVNVFAILDRACERVDRIPGELGLVDSADGQRSGLFFKTNYLFRAIKQLFLRHAKEKTTTEVEQSDFIPAQGVEAGIKASAFQASTTEDEFVMDLSNEPWLADLLDMDLTWKWESENLPWSQYSEY